jgi:excisionase family DNA binding protein
VQPFERQPAFWPVEVSPALGNTTVSDTRLLTAEELAERWRVSKAQVYRQAREGQVPCVQIGRYYRFRLASIEAWEAAQEEAAADA